MARYCIALGILLGLPFAAAAQDRVGITLSAGVLTGQDAAPLGDFTRPLFAGSIQRVFTQRSTMRTASTSLDQRTCDPFENITGRGPVVMLRVLGGVEIPLTPRTGITSSIRAERPRAKIAVNEWHNRHQIRLPRR